MTGLGGARVTGLRLVVVLVAAVVGLGGGAVTAILHSSDDGLVRFVEPTAQDPLGLGIDLVDVDCDGKSSLLVVGWGNTDTAFTTTVADWPGAHYLQTSRSCPSAWPFENGKPPPQYVAYFPTFASATPACELKMQAVHKGDFVTRMRADTEDPVPCACVIDRADLPPITEGQQATTESGMWTLLYQQMLAEAGLLDLAKVQRGSFDKPTVDATYTLQTDNALSPTGIVDGDTWRELSNKSCSRFKF